MLTRTGTLATTKRIQKPMDGRWHSRHKVSTKLESYRSLSMLLCMVYLAPLPADAEAPAYNLQPKTCGELAAKILANRNILAATSEITLAEGSTPAYCQVNLTQHHAINIRVGLPLNPLDSGTSDVYGAWNGKVQNLGNGGYAGTVPPVEGPVAAGYVGSSTDNGHSVAWCNAINPETGLPNAQPDCGVGGGGFVLDPFNRLIRHQISDFVKEANAAQTRWALRLTRWYYGREAERNYWVGCSEGGREGLEMAQSYPELFDGYLVGAPGINLNRFIIGSVWSDVVTKDLIGPSGLSQAKISATATAVLEACDLDDGVADGIVNEPRRCSFDANELLCTGDPGDPNTCLTPQEANAINLIWDGPRNWRGKRLWGGPSKDTTYFVGQIPSPLRMAWLQYWMHQDPLFDWTQINTSNYPAQFQLSYRKFKGTAASDSTKLKKVEKRGAKIIHYHGIADPLIPPFTSYNYVGRLFERYGVKKTQSFMRSFFYPGVGHCGGGSAPQPNAGDLLQVLENWVENGVAPKYVVASQTLSDGTVRTRKVCKYPDEAVYNGTGSSDHEANFQCRVNHQVPTDLAAAALTNKDKGKQKDD